MVKDLDLKSILDDIKTGIKRAKETTINKEKILTDLQDFCVEICNTKKIINDIVDCINIDSITDNDFKIKRQYKLQSVLTDLQSVIENLTEFVNDNK